MRWLFSRSSNFTRQRAALCSELVNVTWRSAGLFGRLPIRRHQTALFKPHKHWVERARWNTGKPHDLVTMQTLPRIEQRSDCRFCGFGRGADSWHASIIDIYRVNVKRCVAQSLCTRGSHPPGRHRSAFVGPLLHRLSFGVSLALIGRCSDAYSPVPKAGAHNRASAVLTDSTCLCKLNTESQWRLIQRRF